MDPEIKKELDEIRAFEQDNRRMLRAIRRDQWIGFIWKIIFWTALIVVPYYAYQLYLAPIIAQIMALPSTATSNIPGLSSLPNLPSVDLQNLLHSVQAGQTK